MKKRIVCFGDSLTWGADPAGGPRLEERWPLVLQDELGSGYTVIEEGLGGRTIAADDPVEGEKNGLRQILPCLETHSPFDLLIVMLGTNDCKRKYNYSDLDIAWGMERFLEKVFLHRHFRAEDGYQMLLIAPPPINEGIQHSPLGDLFACEEGRARSEHLADSFRPLAERFGCRFMDAAQYAHSSPIDGIHMNAVNETRLAHAIAERVREMLE